MLNQPPVVIWKNWYLLVAGASAVLGMLLQPVFARADWLITVLDAVVMAHGYRTNLRPRSTVVTAEARLTG